MTPPPARCLILACGNPLRGDDGIGPSLAEWAEDHFRGDPAIRVIFRQQWTPELADDIAQAASVLFVDASAESAAGVIHLARIEPAQEIAGLATHHLDAAQLLGLCGELYSVVPRNALLLTIGIDSTDLGAPFSQAVKAAIPQARALLHSTVSRLLKPDGE